MTGLLNIPIEMKTLEERGLPADSFFEVVFSDGSIKTEVDTNWSSISEPVRVDYFGQKKDVLVCKYPTKSVRIRHEGLVVDLEVPEDCEVYQAVRSQVVFIQEQQNRSKISGRVVGLVKDGKVIEERFLNGRTQEVLGMRL